MIRVCGLSNVTSSTLYQLNYTCTTGSNGTTATYHNYAYNLAAGINFTLFAICTLTVILTCFKFNSITVLNIRVRPTAISNILWIFYFCILGFRSLILGIVYIDDGYIFRCKKDLIPKILIPTENVLKILEVLFLSWTLEYQRKHRSKGFIQDELNRFNDGSEESTSAYMLFKKTLRTTYNIFTAQAFLCLVFLVIFTIFLLKNTETTTEYMYWTYHGFLWSLCISCIVLMVIIVAQRLSDEGPSRLTKVLLFCGVVFTLPADIPLFIWQQCICQDSSLPIPVGYVVSQVLLIIAVVLFLVVLIREFHRLKEEAQWNVIDQAESYYNITESM